MKPTLLFDLDGTLTDSQPGIVRCFQFALEKGGEMVPAADDLRFVLGPPLGDSFRRLLPGISNARVDELIGFYRDRFVPTGMFENRVYPGIVEALTKLRREHTLFVATSKPVRFAGQIIEHFGLRPYFQEIYGAELDGTRSNKADLIRHLVKSEGLLAGTCVMIGDREHDILGARACGMGAVGVLWGYGGAVELNAAGADTVVETPAQLSALF